MDTKIFDTLLEPAFVIDAEKKILYCNEPAALIAGISVRKIQRSQPFLDQLFKFAEPVESLSALTALTEPSAYQELKFTTEDQREGKVQLTIQPFHQSQWLVYFRDVTLEETLQKKYRAELEQKEDVIKDLQVAQAELQNYSKNLEKMVEERTAEVRRLNQLMTALLDSLQQGFFVFDPAGKCLEVFSRACSETLQTEPTGKNVWDVLKLEDRQVPGFKKWLTTVFSEMLPFEDLAPLGPQKFPHTDGKHIKLEYYPLRQADNSIGGVVVVATDISELIHAQEQAETDRARSQMILKLVESRKQALGFLQEAEILFAELRSEIKKDQGLSIEDTFRILHTLKGGAASFSIQGLTHECHEAESLITLIKSEAKPELFLQLKERTKNIFDEYRKFTEENSAVIGSPERRKHRWLEFDAKHVESFANKQLQAFPDLKEAFVENFLTEPISEHFLQYEEVAQITAERVGKKIAPIEWTNQDLRVYSKDLGSLFATFVHVFRNAVDHGIETPESRLAAGKSEEGHIAVSFSKAETPEGPALRIKIVDDGGGIPADKIRAKLVSKGIPVESKTDHQIIQHVFDSQLSTKETVSDISGRGVGLDAVLTAAKKLGGTAWVDSTPGRGTALSVEVPLTQLKTSSNAA